MAEFSEPADDLSIYGKWDFVERLLELFPGLRPTFDANSDFHDRLPHVVFGIGWWPWLEPQLDGDDRHQLLASTAQLFSEMLASGNESWHEVAVLSGLEHFLRDQSLWGDLRAAGDARVNAEMTRMEPHYHLPRKRNTV
ncbi:MAG TPA: hypothetical protein VFY90_00180 [Tepidiformaceae bacterium]|nr:hypothetical protein [Tepidiformaceae bacterium]